MIRRRAWRFGAALAVLATVAVATPVAAGSVSAASGRADGHHGPARIESVGAVAHGLTARVTRPTRPVDLADLPALLLVAVALLVLAAAVTRPRFRPALLTASTSSRGPPRSPSH